MVYIGPVLLFLTIIIPVSGFVCLFLYIHFSCTLKDYIKCELRYLQGLKTLSNLFNIALHYTYQYLPFLLRLLTVPM